MHDPEQFEAIEGLEGESFSYEFGEERDGGAQEINFKGESPLEEVEEMELAAELLSVSSEEELDQFLGNLFKKVGSVVGRIAKPLGGILKVIAKKALPIVGGALGSFIPIPGVGTAVGTALGSAASKLLEVDFEGMSEDDQQFEVARRFVRLASTAAAQAGAAAVGTDPKAAATAAIQAAVARLPGTKKPKNSGRWFQHGRTIVVLGA